jgi:predicted thioesterase
MQMQAGIFHFRCVKSIFKVGDKKTFERIVRAEDTATFETGTVHEVYATFALTRDAEWSSRLFVLEMKEENEEGIGTFVSVKHISPAFIGETVLFEAVIDELKGNEVNCTFVAKVEERIIAEGRTGQKILTKEKTQKIFGGIKK